MAFQNGTRREPRIGFLRRLKRWVKMILCKSFIHNLPSEYDFGHFDPTSRLQVFGGHSCLILAAIELLTDGMKTAPSPY